MAQVKLIEHETPQTFKPVTIQVTFETQEELNAMSNICGNQIKPYESIQNVHDIFKTNLKSWNRISGSIYHEIKPFAK